VFTQLITTSSCYNTTRVSMNERPEQQTTTRSEISSYLEARSGEKRGELRAYVDEEGRRERETKDFGLNTIPFPCILVKPTIVVKWTDASERLGFTIFHSSFQCRAFSTAPPSHIYTQVSLFRLSNTLPSNGYHAVSISIS